MLTRNPFGTGIRVRFMLVMLAVLTASSVIATWLIARRQAASLEQSLVDRGNSLGAFMAKLSWEPLLTNETHAARRRGGRRDEDAKTTWSGRSSSTRPARP